MCLLGGECALNWPIHLQGALAGSTLIKKVTMDQSITELTMIIRLCLAFAAGGIIGIERSSRRQVAGLRTHILISLGASCLMLLSIWLPEKYAGGDPGRIAAQVVTGMGFLGAGAIIRLGVNIKGLTTAASLWLTAAIGLTIGAGMYTAAFTSAILALVTLTFLNKLERKIFPDVRIKSLEISYTHKEAPDIEPVLEIFKKFNIVHQSLKIITGNNFRKKTRVHFVISILNSTNLSKLANALKLCDSVDQIEIKEKSG